MRGLMAQIIQKNSKPLARVVVNNQNVNYYAQVNQVRGPMGFQAGFNNSMLGRINGVKAGCGCGKH